MKKWLMTAVAAAVWAWAWAAPGGMGICGTTGRGGGASAASTVPEQGERRLVAYREGQAVLTVEAGRWGSAVAVVGETTNTVAGGTTANFQVPDGSKVEVWAVPDEGFAFSGEESVEFASFTNDASVAFAFEPDLSARLKWKYAKNANGWFCAQIAIPWHEGYNEAISDLRFLFADRTNETGKATAYLVDPATVVDPLGTTETHDGMTYRYAPLGIAPFAALSGGDRAVFGVTDATMTNSLDSVPKAERTIPLRVTNRDITTVEPLDNKVGWLAWKTDGNDYYLPIAGRAPGHDVSSMTPAQIAADMGVGWSLGNTLDAHDAVAHMKMGLGSETYWGNPKATQALIDAVKAKGFTTIRIPVTWYPHADANYTIDSLWMNRVKQVVDWCIDGGYTYVILNNHHEEWNRPSNANLPEASKQLKAFWKQIAIAFKDYDRHLIFEGMNEPRNYNGVHEWDGGTFEMREVVNKLDKDFVDAVRATGGKNTTRCLMIPTYAASPTAVAMRSLSIPNDPNVMVSIHAYTPYNFTRNTGSGGTAVFDSTQENELRQLFTDIDNIFLSKGKTVVIGEFSSSNKNNTSERVKWANSYATLARDNRIPIVLWDNNCPVDRNNDGSGHGYINRRTLKWYDTAEPVVDALLRTYFRVKAASPSLGTSRSSIASQPLAVAALNQAASFGLTPAAMARAEVVCRIASIDVDADGGVAGTFEIAAADADGIVAESGALAPDVALTVLGADTLFGDFEELDAEECGVELTGREPPYGFRVRKPGAAQYFQVKLEAEDRYE